MESKAHAEWTGGLKDGKGSISTGSEVLDSVPFSFATRFEGENGTNPEELIAAAHAACFSMALSAELGKALITSPEIYTSASVLLTKDGQGFSVTESRLVATVNAPRADVKEVERAAAAAKENCPISKLLKAKISLTLSVNT